MIWLKINAFKTHFYILAHVNKSNFIEILQNLYNEQIKNTASK